jgi:hypothetical protein
VLTFEEQEEDSSSPVWDLRRLKHLPQTDKATFYSEGLGRPTSVCCGLIVVRVAS